MKKGENMKKKIKIAVFMMFCIFAFYRVYKFIGQVKESGIG